MEVCNPMLVSFTTDELQEFIEELSESCKNRGLIGKEFENLLDSIGIYETDMTNSVKQMQDRLFAHLDNEENRILLIKDRLWKCSDDGNDCNESCTVSIWLEAYDFPKQKEIHLRLMAIFEDDVTVCIGKRIVTIRFSE